MPFERDELPAPATAETTTFATAQPSLLPRELPPPTEMAEMLKRRPDRQQMLFQLQQTAGNAYVQQVMQAATAEPEAGIASVGGGGGEGGDAHADVVVTVKVAPNPTQQQVLDAIARSPAFGFQDADVAALNNKLAETPELLFVQVDGKTPASTAEIEKRVNPRTRLVTITLHGRDAGLLESLKAGRATGSVDAVLNAIDPQLRAMLRPQLLALLGPAGDARNAAAEELAHLIDNDKPIAPILEALAARGYASDPLVSVLRGLASAKASQAPADFVGPVTKPGILDPDRAGAAEREATAASDTLNAQQATGGANRAEAATVYDLTARLYDKTGNREARDDAELKSRFYGIGRTECDQAIRTRAKWIDRDEPSQTKVMRPTSETQIALDEVREETDRLIEQNEGGRSAAEVPEAGNKREPLPVETRGQSSEWLAAEREAEERAESRYIAPIALINATFGFIGTLRMMGAMTKLIAAQDRLKREQWIENHYPVPPPVAELEKLLEFFHREAARGGKAGEAAKRDAMQVERVLELSRIFYDLPG